MTKLFAAVTITQTRVKQEDNSRLRSNIIVKDNLIIPTMYVGERHIKKLTQLLLAPSKEPYLAGY